MCLSKPFDRRYTERAAEPFPQLGFSAYNKGQAIRSRHLPLETLAVRFAAPRSIVGKLRYVDPVERSDKSQS